MRPDKRRTTTTHRALVPRPATGLQAWQATLGYMSMFHSPDALLNIAAQPHNDGLHWSATVTWGYRAEGVRDQPTLADALRTLWHIIDRHHNVFLAAEDSTRAPANYDDQEWLDIDTREILHRLILTTQTVFEADWRLIIFYRPLDTPQRRVQMRLLAQANSVIVGGRGPSQMDATHAIFRHAAPVFAAHSGITRT